MQETELKPILCSKETPKPMKLSVYLDSIPERKFVVEFPLWQLLYSKGKGLTKDDVYLALFMDKSTLHLFIQNVAEMEYSATSPLEGMVYKIDTIHHKNLSISLEGFFPYFFEEGEKGKVLISTLFCDIERKKSE